MSDSLRNAEEKVHLNKSLGGFFCHNICWGLLWLRRWHKCTLLWQILIQYQCKKWLLLTASECKSCAWHHPVQDSQKQASSFLCFILRVLKLFEPNLKLWVNKRVGSPRGRQVGCAGTFPAPGEETLLLQLSDRPWFGGTGGPGLDSDG